MTFLKLLRRPTYVWALEEINRDETEPTGTFEHGLAQVDSVNDLIATNMLAQHHAVAQAIGGYINNNNDQSLLLEML